MDNPVYDISGGHETTPEGERNLENPIYGLPDEEAPADVTIAANGHYDFMYT